jgi:hypothetical protein
MGLSYVNTSTYYDTNGDHGNYRFLSLEDFISGFMAAYTGHGKICGEAARQDVTFHSIRAIQELSFDTFRNTKDWEVVIPNSLVLVMPHDYVNYTKIAWIDEGGLEHRIYPTRHTSNPAQEQNTIADHGGYNATYSVDETSTARDNFESRQVDPSSGSHNTDKDVYDALLGARYGLSPEQAQTNGTFYIDESAGKFHFSSNMAGKTLVLKYISDGIISSSGNIHTASIVVPKLAEEAITKHVMYGVLLGKADTPAGTLALIKKERFAEVRKAKLRLSNLKSEEIAQIMRGKAKHIKH